MTAAATLVILALSLTSFARARAPGRAPCPVRPWSLVVLRRLAGDRAQRAAVRNRKRRRRSGNSRGWLVRFAGTRDRSD